MLIYLLRHGVAEDAGPSTDYRDEPRRLTPEGIHKMEAEARGMVALGIAADVVLHSPLVRCVETAQIVAEALSVPLRAHPALAPGADVDAVTDQAAAHPDADALMFCGHEPDMSSITGDLTGGYVDFKKGTLAVIELPKGRYGGGILRALYPPRTLRTLGGSE